ncbi:hypothetical protein PPERSA_03486 [Pseudocohnilembus persalinus]|uniref:Uncharacterized protein n=1 Tax=Pseudocohnilembus persalinus TaxID=266149 RepID=A0A0V0QBT5_PSEPJ|nr:hypothetical protein PPERSA_03486 [Pseudocohnilembus persalinus]|eukprot:KRW99685.1 hypothetical protein PPERSA_03486 [Pseudocohnilembus persalinus]
MDLQQVKTQVAQVYRQNCEGIKKLPNKRLLQTLEEEISEEEQQTNQISVVFRGNDKFNFNCRLNDTDMIIFTETLFDFAENIRHIDLSYNQFQEEGANTLSGLLERTVNLESLNLQGNEIQTQGGQKIAAALKENTSLRYLNLANNKIKTDGAISIIDFLFYKENLLELNLADNEIHHDGMIGIASVLNWNNNTLQVLNVDNPVYTSIGQETAIHFAKMLQSNRSLEKLSLQKHQFTCEAIYTITEHLLENKTLRVLDLTANKIAFKGCEALAKYLLGEYCSLESLILANNRTGHYGAKAIAQALSKNRTLIHVDMTRNNIDDGGLKMIAESLETNNTLVSLKLYYNDFGQAALQEFHNLQQKPRKGDWFWDFQTYIVGNQIEMAYSRKCKIAYNEAIKLKNENNG